jgi:hypothetical protein
MASIQCCVWMQVGQRSSVLPGFLVFYILLSCLYLWLALVHLFHHVGSSLVFVLCSRSRCERMRMVDKGLWDTPTRMAVRIS